MLSSLWRKRSNTRSVRNRQPVRIRSRLEIELLETRRLLSLSVGPNVNMSRLRTSQAEA